MFEDFLTCTVSALSNQQMEREYLEVVAKGYGDGKEGRRGIDSLTLAFATLISLMEETRRDVIGDLFQGGITYGEAGQFLTPERVTNWLSSPGFTARRATAETSSSWRRSWSVLLRCHHQRLDPLPGAISWAMPSGVVGQSSSRMPSVGRDAPIGSTSTRVPSGSSAGWSRTI